ncbi:MAG: XdhC family protein [Nitrospirales bacterium]|nr:XdhC family protein [Nitrospira sp.]MDR4501519.1 XdhC family protein [Nitrospirales bacterium]
MANHLLHLLTQWRKQPEDCEWVLGTVYKTEGPCYRKPGAMMLFNGLGEQFGLLSGGCLEADIQRQARRVMLEGRARTCSYDTHEDEHISHVASGCGGTVHVLLQPVNAQAHFLHLEAVFQALSERKTGLYYQRIPDSRGSVESRFIGTEAIPRTGVPPRSELIEEDDAEWLITPIVPVPHLFVAGGGADARPLVAIAHQLSWQVSVWDPRPANARREHFLNADWILKGAASDLFEFVLRKSVDAVVLMTHNIQLDSEALNVLRDVPLHYMALLGPIDRRLKVLEQAQMTESELKTPLAGPAGLDIGAELPESIALSILAECHASLMRRSACSLTGVLV